MSAAEVSLRGAFAEFKGRAIWVVLGCLICQMGLGFTYIRTGLSIELVEGLSLTRDEFSTANMPQLALQAIASPIVGILTVRLGASRVLGLASAFFAFVFFGFSRIDSVAGFYVVAAALGLGAAGMGDITVGHVVSQWFHKNRGLALGIAYAGSNLGGSLMVGLVGAVAAQGTWRDGMLAVIPVALFVLLPTSLWLIRDTPDEAHRTLVGTSAAPDSTEVSTGGDHLDLKSAVRTRSFWILTFTLFTFFFYMIGILDHLVLFLVDSGLSKDEARTAFRQAVGLGVVSKILGGFFSDRIPQLRAIQTVYFMLGASSLVLLGLPHPILLPVFVFSFGFSQACRDVVYPLVLGRCFGDRYQGEIYGAMMLTLFPGGALGPVFAAVIRQEFGNYDAAFGTFALLNMLGFLGLLLVRDERQGHASH